MTCAVILPIGSRAGGAQRGFVLRDRLGALRIIDRHIDNRLTDARARRLG
jgi:hypothetical protein